MKFIRVSHLIGILVFLSACGGGSNTMPFQPTNAIVSLATSQTSTTIYGIEATFVLPSGVTVKSTVNPPQTDDGVVISSGVAAGCEFIGVYSEATSTLAGSVKVLIPKANGFGTGKFATINCDITSGHYPAAGDFSITDVKAWDSQGSEIPNVLSEISVDIN